MHVCMCSLQGTFKRARGNITTGYQVASYPSTVIDTSSLEQVWCSRQHADVSTRYVIRLCHRCTYLGQHSESLGIARKQIQGKLAVHHRCLVMPVGSSQ